MGSIRDRRFDARPGSLALAIVDGMRHGTRWWHCLDGSIWPRVGSGSGKFLLLRRIREGKSPSSHVEITLLEDVWVYWDIRR